MAGLLALAFDPLVNSMVLPVLVTILPEWIGRAVEDQTFIITSMTVLGIIFPVYNGFAWRILSDGRNPVT